MWLVTTKNRDWTKRKKKSLRVYVTNKNNVKTWGHFMAFTGKLFRTSLSVWVVEIRVLRTVVFWWENIKDNYLYIYRYRCNTTKKFCTFRSTTAFQSKIFSYDVKSLQFSKLGNPQHPTGFRLGLLRTWLPQKKDCLWWSVSFFYYPTNLRLLIQSSRDRQLVHPA